MRHSQYLRAIAFGLLTYLVTLLGGAAVVTAAGATPQGGLIPFAVVKYVAIVGAGCVASMVVGGGGIGAGLLAGATIGSVTLLLTLAGQHAILTDLLEIALSAGLGLIGAVMRLPFYLRLYRYPVVRYPVGLIFVAYGSASILAWAVAHLLYVASVASPGHAQFSPITYGAVASFGSLGIVSVILGQRILRTPGEYVLRARSEEFVLYLRSFKDDSLTMPGVREKTKNSPDIVRSMFRGFDVAVMLVTDSSWEGHLIGWLREAVGPVVAIAKPGETLPPKAGAARLFVRRDWESTVADLLQRCRVVLVALGRTEGLAWELREIVNQGAEKKLIVVVPPLAKEEIDSRWSVFRYILSSTCEGENIPDLPEGVRFVQIPRSAAPVFFSSPDHLEEGYRSALDDLLSRSRIRDSAIQ